jgi:hypothetical protein
MQEVPGVEEELDKDAVSLLFSSTYTTRTLPTKKLLKGLKISK